MVTYGIDLGTTYSCIAYIDESGRPVVLRSALGEETTPSVVYFESPESIVVGRSAKDTAVLRPDLVVSHIKRQMGQRVELSYHGHAYTPESISALILKELARATGEQMGEPVQDVVVTVPAYFGLAEREATRKAAEIAGFRVLNLVPEPVAAALHYEALTGDEGRTVLVYDLGGGTFDTTVIRLDGAAVRVVCTDGDHLLGGADWDDRLAGHLLERFQSAHPDQDPAGDEGFLQELAIDAERLKKDLSSVQVRKPTLRFGGVAEQFEVTREQFEQLTSELLQRTLEITERTIATARERGVERFDEVLLVGGASRMPAVSEALQARFGFEPRLHDPDLAVAKGAARYAQIESVKVRLPEESGAVASGPALEEVAAQLGLSSKQVKELAERTITTVVPRAFGLGVTDISDPARRRQLVDHLLHANDPLPATVGPKTYYTVDDDQTAIEVTIWEQAGAAESDQIENNTEIGGSVISGLPPLPKGSPVETTFDMDEMGTLRVHAVEASTRKEVRIELKIGGMDSSQAERARDLIAAARVSA
jgi:molecular chaperone DnaK